VLFVASKADHVLPEQHAALVSLLQQLVRGSAGIARFQGVPSDCMALASVMATELATGRTPDGESVRGLRGYSIAGQPLLVKPQALPEGMPTPDWWQGAARFDRFRPRSVDATQTMPHIRLDAALEFLLADKVA
jgi:predicted YcjX-like family ATPase